MAEKDTVGTNSKGGKKTLLIIIVAALLFLLAGGGAALYFLVLKKPAAEQEELNKEAQMVQAPAAPTDDIGPMVNIEQFIVNIISEDTPHYVKAALTLELTNPMAVEEANKRMPQIRDAVLLLIGNKTFEELQDLQGKNQIKAEIKNRINSFLKSGQVKNIYLTDFVVQ
jgi:flagellar protein FliL